MVDHQAVPRPSADHSRRVPVRLSVRRPDRACDEDPLVGADLST
jgi:hypothetical protein